MAVDYRRNLVGEAYVTRAPFGPVGKDLRRRTTLANVIGRQRAPVGEGRAADPWAPQRVPGQLRRSIHSEVTTRGGFLLGTVTADARREGELTSYAAAVHEGAEAHPIVPRRKKWLRWPGADGRDVFRRAVYHPGIRKGQPFFREALEAARR